MSTIHNPTNFDPKQYEVLDYLDAKRPVYFGQGVESWKYEVQAWEDEMQHTFGPDWRSKPFTKCVHCGHNPLRWLTVVRHTPTGEVVVFGADCTKRLEFVDQKTFKLAQLQSRDEARKVRIKVWNQREKFLVDHPVFAAVIDSLDKPEHAKNWFVKDVVAKLGQYGSLSDAQVNAVLQSLERDRQYAARKATEVTEIKGDAPSGRQTVTGVVLSIKDHESQFGFSQKMTVKLTNGSRVWVTVPSKEDVSKGDTVTFTATFDVSQTDKTFAFGRRPHLVSRRAGWVDDFHAQHGDAKEVAE